MSKSQNLDVFWTGKVKNNKNSGIEDNMAICRTYSEVWQRGTTFILMPYLSHTVASKQESRSNPCSFTHPNFDPFDSFSII